MLDSLIRQFPDAEAVCQAAAHEFVRLAGEAIAARDRFVVALAGGSTPRRLYELLSAPPYRNALYWPSVEFFWGDERSVAPDHKDSNYRMACASLLDQIPELAAQLAPADADGAGQSRVHRMQAERSDRDQAAAEYQAVLARVFDRTADSEPPELDLVLLGMGADGHTASLFPHTAALSETTRWVMANHVPQLQTDRLTMTVPPFNAARHVLFLVTGAETADTLAEVLEGPPDTDRLPSQLIHPTGGSLSWLIDHAAAGRLKS